MKVVKSLDIVNDYIEKLEQENKQLKSILTELEEWLEEISDYEEYDRVERDTMNMILNKIQELKEKYK